MERHSDSYTVGDPIRGKVIVRKLFVLVPFSNEADDLIKFLAEFFHGQFHWLLYEVLIWIRTQEQLVEEDTKRSL